MSDDKERLAAWMIRQGFATGHGDTAEALLEELRWQIAEIAARRDELLEALERVKATGVFLGAIPQEMVDAAIAKAKGE